MLLTCLHQALPQTFAWLGYRKRYFQQLRQTSNQNLSWSLNSGGTLLHGLSIQTFMCLLINFIDAVIDEFGLSSNY
jgi:hypothetical protein